MQRSDVVPDFGPMCDEGIADVADHHRGEQVAHSSEPGQSADEEVLRIPVDDDELAGSFGLAGDAVQPRSVRLPEDEPELDGDPGNPEV